jgi:hypothetical protein
MIEIIYLISFIIFLLGLSGSVIPGLPGPLISYLGVVLLYGATNLPISSSMIWVLGFFMALSTAGDYILQILGVKKLGGGKNAIRGTMIGTILGLFVPPVGIILGALIGAFIGARSETDSDSEALKITLGAFIGFILGTLIKLVYCIYVIYYIITLF